MVRIQKAKQQHEQQNRYILRLEIFVPLIMILPRKNKFPLSYTACWWLFGGYLFMIFTEESVGI